MDDGEKISQSNKGKGKNNKSSEKIKNVRSTVSFPSQTVCKL